MSAQFEVSKLAGYELDYWVTKVVGVDAVISDVYPNGSRCMVTYYSRDENDFMDGRSYCPSDHWSDGGPIIFEWGIGTSQCEDPALGKWVAKMKVEGGKSIVAYGDTPLQAAMRALVMSCFGATVGPVEYPALDVYGMQGA